ncbi:hypothetical protein FKM82_008015 [Ascaphus truei]
MYTVVAHFGGISSNLVQCFCSRETLMVSRCVATVPMKQLLEPVSGGYLRLCDQASATYDGFLIPPSFHSVGHGQLKHGTGPVLQGSHAKCR